jgi:protein-tyrosine-phosphatase/predicted ATP-grasp superfamily ATP-dependent carboligase
VPPSRVLVLGDDVRSFLAVVRSLGRRGIEVDACPFDYGSIALRSRYIRRSYRLPPYSVDSGRWLAAMKALLDTGHYDLVIPCDDRTIIPLMRYAADFPDTVFALPNPEAFDAFYDKHNTRELARSVDVPVAPGRLLEPDDTADRLIAEFGLPQAIKPRRSYALERPEIRQGVVICTTREALQERLSEIAHREEYFVEGFFDGVGVGVSVLASKGRVLQAFEHHRVQEPVTGGGSSYRISAEVDPRMRACVERASAASKLNGVAMFEFRYNAATDDFILLEVNARLWGSLPLPVAAGLDFPYLLYRLLADRVEEPPQSYRIGFYGRNVTADMYSTLQNFSHLRSREPKVAWRYLMRSLAQWLRVFTFNERHDCFAFDDMTPALLEYGQLIDAVGHALWKRVPFTGGLRRNAARKAVWRAVRGRRDITLLVICQGNICRSPMAEVVLRRELGGHNGIYVRSAGMLPLSGRPSPENAVKAAQELGLDLATHRSSFADDRMIREADLIVVFDEVNELAIRQRSLGSLAPVLRIGDLEPASQGDGQIFDPYGGDVAVFEKAYRRIEKSSRVLALMVREGMGREAA